jgi:hypothetical protein
MNLNVPNPVTSEQLNHVAVAALNERNSERNQEISASDRQTRQNRAPPLT